jgi:hypothetical protein
MIRGSVYIMLLGDSDCIDNIEEDSRRLLWSSFNPRIIESLSPWALFSADLLAHALGLGLAHLFVVALDSTCLFTVDIDY